MSAPNFRFIDANNIRLHVAEQGMDAGSDAPLVLLLHGFPESWYSWRHQLPALAAAGYRAVAPDMRGYGLTDRPDAIEDYDGEQLTADVAGLIDAYKARSAVVIGHDWGAWVAWQTAYRYRETVSAVGALSVPYTPRAKALPTDMMKKIFADRFFYQLYFQKPGVAEAELEADVRRSLRLILFSGSGDSGRNNDFMNKNRNAGLLDGMADPADLPDWLSDADLTVFEDSFRHSGFRGPINWYRNIDRNWQRGDPGADQKIYQPALYICGDKDLVLQMRPDALEVMPPLVPNLRQCEILPGCGHWTQQERPDDVNSIILEFLGNLGL